MSKEKLEGLNTNNNVLTSKGTRAFKRRNVVKAAVAATSLVGGTGVGIGVGYAIFHNNQTNHTPVYNVVFNTGYSASMDELGSQTIQATARDNSSVTLSASGNNNGNWVFTPSTTESGKGILEYKEIGDEKITVTITATNDNDESDSNSIKIDLLPTAPEAEGIIKFESYTPSLKVTEDQEIVATTTNTSDTLTLTATGVNTNDDNWTFEDNTLTYLKAFDEKETITITATSSIDPSNTNSIKIDLLPQTFTTNLVATNAIEIPESIVYQAGGKIGYKPLFTEAIKLDSVIENISNNQNITEADVEQITIDTVDGKELLTYYYDSTEPSGQLHITLGEDLYNDDDHEGVYRETEYADRFLPSSNGYDVNIKLKSGYEQKVKIIINPKGTIKEYVTNEVYRAIGFITNFNKYYIGGSIDDSTFACMAYTLREVKVQDSYQELGEDAPLQNIKFRITGHDKAYKDSLITYPAFNISTNPITDDYLSNIPIFGSDYGTQPQYLEGYVPVEEEYTKGDFICGNAWKYINTSSQHANPWYDGEYFSTCMPIDIEFNFKNSNYKYSVTTNIELYSVLTTTSPEVYPEYNTFTVNNARLMVGDFAFA